MHKHIIGSLLDRMSVRLRQWKYPPEFRIMEPPPMNLWLEELRQLAVKIGSDTGTVSGPREDIPADNVGRNKMLRQLGTGLWRVWNSARDPSTGAAKQGMERIYKHACSVMDASESNGLLIKDHTGESWDDGRMMEAIAFQEVDHFDGEKIIETVRPSVFYRDEQIQTAQVIVSKPEQGEGLNGVHANTRG